MSSITANITNLFSDRSANAPLNKILGRNGIKLFLGAAALGVAGWITLASRPAPIRTNPAIIRIVGSNDLDALSTALGADPAQVNAVDLAGNSTLHIAARGGYAEMVDALISAGADVNLPNRSGWTPLASALASPGKQQAAIVEALLAAGANANVSLSDGTSLDEFAAGIPGAKPQVVRLISARRHAGHGIASASAQAGDGR